MIVRIRAVDPFEDDDAADDIRHLHSQCMPDDELPDLTTGFWWIGRDTGGTPVAYAGLHPSRKFCDAGYLCAAGVAPKARGNGLQRRLIQARETKARQLGWRWLITDTIPNNPASSNTLISCGFRTYVPSDPWRLAGAIYWKKPLCQKK